MFLEILLLIKSGEWDGRRGVLKIKEEINTGENFLGTGDVVPHFLQLSRHAYKKHRYVKKSMKHNCFFFILYYSLDYRRKWNDDLHKYLNTLNEKKPVIFCGDLNVAHNEIGKQPT